MPVATGRDDAGRAPPAPHARGTGSRRQTAAVGARRASGPRGSARDRPPRRHVDPRSNRRRFAQGRARGAAPAADPRRELTRRIGVAATAQFGADVLERLAARHEIAFLLTRPDAPAGRGRRVTAPPAKVVAERLELPVLQPERLTGADLPTDVDAIVVAAYGLLIPESLLEQTLWLNVHPSLLPRWRGAAPVERALMAGDRETGVTIHRTVKELDAGPIAAQAAFIVDDAMDAGAVFRRSAELAAELLGGGLAKTDPG